MILAFLASVFISQVVDRVDVTRNIVFDGVIKSTLVIGAYGASGFPVEAWENVYLKEGDKFIRVKKLDDLAGKVHIRSRKSALQFVRILTSPRTYWMGKYDDYSCVVELIPAGHLTMELVQQNKILYRFLTGYFEPQLGYWAKRPWRKEFGSTSVEMTKEGFRVERTVATENKIAGYTVERSAEDLSFDGNTRRTVIWRKDGAELGVGREFFIGPWR